jgi:tRNA-dihydrouridine synthase 2
MGCPKHFSVSGGMGAALLSNATTACSILRALVAQFPQLHVSCKIRLLESTDATIALMRQLAATGVWNIAVHCRERHERPRDE